MQTLEHDRTIAAPPSDAERQDLLRFSALLLQLVGVAWVVHRFQIESTAFVQLIVLTVVGFAVHYFLPLRYRLPFFLLLSVAGIGLVLGVVQGAWLLALGLGLIGIAHLPIRIGGRVALLLIACGTLFLIRTRLEAPWSTAVWPILASMFMFRMVVYMYDLGTGQGQASLSQRLSYFFLLPNVCFPLFPVVDFRTFVRNYYSGPRHDIHQVGVEWMVRGIVQLLLYRGVQLWFAISPYDVENVVSLGRYFLSLYLLYLCISGQFHLIVGILHLFGFNLPETHRRYYLASSFTDFWRRINIYWKDFMMKVFYYPIFFRLRRFGHTRALVLSTICVFVLTWALHAYQAFWIRGFFRFSWNDTLFWAILCGLVVVNSLYEVHYGRRRALSRQSRGLRSEAVLMLKTAATFIALCILWSFWSSESVSSWLSLWPSAMQPSARHQIDLVLGLAGAGILAIVLSFTRRSRIVRWPQPGFVTRSATVAGWLILLGALSMPEVHGALGSPGSVIASIRVPRLNTFQLEELERGYYEDLLTVDRFNRELGALYAKRPLDWERTLSDLGVQRAGTELGNLVPNAEVLYRGAIFRTNRWGMHDKNYSLETHPDTFRIALLGASHVMGMGVQRHATFEAVLEDRLNREMHGTRFVRYEILNFAFQNFTAFEQIRLLERKVTAFRPDAVWYVGHPYELKRVVRRIRMSVQSVDPSDRQAYPRFSELAQRAGVDENTSVYLAERRLARFGDEIFLKLFGTIVDLCRRHQMHPVYVHMPLTPESRNDVDETPYVELARRAGFVTLDLTGVYDGYTRDAVWVAEWDAHPNEFGHRLVAGRLFELIRQNQAAILSAQVPSGLSRVTTRADRAVLTASGEATESPRHP
jgi:hypothetical protein